MTFGKLVKRGLRFHWRSHLGVVLGAAVGSAALIGALIVGDSVRESLRQRALLRLGNAEHALQSGDRFFRQELGLEFAAPAQGIASAALLQLRGTAANTEGTARANAVQILGVRNYFEFARARTARGNPKSETDWRRETDLPLDGVLLNQALASRLSAWIGDTVLLRFEKPSALSRDAVITPQSERTVTLRLQVNGIVDAQHGGDLDLRASQMPPLNAFVRIEELARLANLPGKANLILSAERRVVQPISKWQQFSRGFWSLLSRKKQSLVASIVPEPQEQAARLNDDLRRRWKFEDTELVARAVNDSVAELSTPRIFLDDAAVQAATNFSRPAGQVTTYTHVLNSKGQVERVEVSDGFTNRRVIPSAVITNGVLMITRSASTAELARAASLGLIPERSATAGATGTVSRPLSGTNYPPRYPRGLAGAEHVTNALPLLTYLVNQFRAGTNTVPYSMVTAVGAPYTPADLRDDEIIVNHWLANDLQIKQGDSIALSYFVADQVSQLTERTNVFRVRTIVPLDGMYADRTLMPEFPGLSKAESTHDWDAGFPLVHKIRPQDEAYWKQHRGTPKAFVTLAAGQRMWANRFGSLTAVRWPAPSGMTGVQFAGAVQQNLIIGLDPKKLGLAFRPVRAEGLRAAEQSQDFGGLFIGFSLFLIAAALILMALLFQFGIEQRAQEIGTLLAVGFEPRRVRKLFLLEGAVLALIGGVIGATGGIGYARLMLEGLTTIWRSATNTSALTFFASPQTLVIGTFSGVIVAVITIWIVLRKQARQPARELLAGASAEPGSSTAKARRGFSKWLRAAMRAPVVAWVCLVFAVITIAAAFATGESTNPEYFFSAGSLCLISGIAFTSLLLGSLLRRESNRHLTARSLSFRGAARRKNRSVATVTLLACGVFLIVAIGAFRLDADQNAWKHSSGTGGFALIGESTLPVLKNLNTSEGRDALGLDEKILERVSIVPFRVREGDDASCLNLNRAQQPRLLGVDPDKLRGRFTFAQEPKLGATGTSETTNGWAALNLRGFAMTGSVRSPSLGDSAAPAIGDAASIQWALHQKIGNVLTNVDERGAEFPIRLVGGLANSILQGSLIVHEAELTRAYPSLSGYRMFLIDCPSNAVPEVSAELSRALEDYGFEVTRAADRLAAFNAVQNTYLNTFQVLGGLGLLLGSLGLGIVVLRNVLERRGELALLSAVGFRRRKVQQMVLVEHLALLCLGLFVGVVSAVIAILPSVTAPHAEFPVASLAGTLGGVILFGLVSTWLATRTAIRGKLLEGLRNE